MKPPITSLMRNAVAQQMPRYKFKHFVLLLPLRLPVPLAKNSIATLTFIHALTLPEPEPKPNSARQSHTRLQPGFRSVRLPLARVFSA